LPPIIRSPVSIMAAVPHSCLIVLLAAPAVHALLGGIKPLGRARVEVARACGPVNEPGVGSPISKIFAHADVKSIEIPEQKIFNGRRFPLTLSPLSPDTGATDLATWGAANQRLLVQLLCTHGAVLLRGWGAGAAQADDFSSLVCNLGLEDFGMGCSAAPRTNVAPGVFTANEAPASELIPFHHEMAQCDERPAFLMFFCEKEAAEGGATPIIPSDAVATYLHARHPELAKKLMHGVRYVRVLPQESDLSSPIGKAWTAAFGASTRAEAEAAMTADDTTWQWLENGDLRTESKTMHALVKNARSGREVFFNSVIAALQGWSDSRNDPKKAILFGDGSELQEAEVAALADVAEMMRQTRVAFGWEQGDVLVIDNAAVMHSRESFTPPRRILASLWGPPTDRRPHALPAGPPAVPMLSLKSLDRMPAVGFGFWKVPKAACAETVLAAIRSGYRHLDCAADYANEAEVGEGIRRAVSEGLVRREDLFVTSKLWNTYHAAQHVEPACRRSLSDLGLDYVDLYLVHFPLAQRYVDFEERYPPEWIYDPDASVPTVELALVPFQETWEAMEMLVSRGLARNIGVCNMGTALLRDVLSYATIPPAVMQIELHAYNQQPQLVRMCHENGIVVTGFSPLGALSYLTLESANEGLFALEHPVVKEIAASHSKSTAQVLLRWGAQRGIAVIPKTTSEERMVENLAIFDFKLSPGEMAQLALLDQGKRFNDPGDFCQGMGARGTFAPIYD